jgi:hypothetical protein
MSFKRQVLVLCLALSAPLAGAQMSQAPRWPVRNALAVQSQAWQLVLLANQSRAQYGAGRLQWDSALAAAAMQHCQRMAVEGPISHQYRGEPDVSARTAQAGAHFSLIEENVAFGPTPDAIHNGWMHSPGHRTNLLNPEVDRVGIAVVAARGELYAVADYERAVQTYSREQVETTVANMVRAAGVAILKDPTIARESCVLDQGFGPGARPGFIMRWQDAQLSQLPQALVDSLATGRYRQAVVGSCPPSGDVGSFTAYRLAVLLY